MDKIEFWHKQIVNDSLCDSGIDLEAFIESGQNIAGDTTSEDEDDLIC